MKVTILNDTSGKHFGCELVMQTYRDQLERVGIEIIKTIPVKTKNIKVPKGTDLVIVNGEGSLHHGRHRQLVTVANRHPAVLLNTVWQNNPNYSALHKFKYISVRESFSFNSLPEGLSNVEVVPDVTFASQFLHTFQKPTPTKEVGVTDNVVEKGKGSGIFALQPANAFIPQMCQYRRWCVGRFHAAVVASVLHVPFSVWPSSTHKMVGLLTDMGVPHFHFKTRGEALKHVPETADERIIKYVDEARSKIERMFENLHNLL